MYTCFEVNQNVLKMITVQRFKIFDVFQRQHDRRYIFFFEKSIRGEILIGFQARFMYSVVKANISVSSYKALEKMFLLRFGRSVFMHKKLGEIFLEPNKFFSSKEKNRDYIVDSSSEGKLSDDVKFAQILISN